MTRQEQRDRYRHLRAINSEQQSAALKFISRPTMMDYGRRLGVLRGRTFVCESTDEMTLVFDLAVHTAPPGRSRAIDRYARSVHPRPGSDEAIMLKAAQDACFRVLRVEGRHAPLGLSVRDITTGEILWLIDEALEASAPVGAVMAGRVMAVDDFIMTCGAVVPLDRDVLLAGGPHLCVGRPLATWWRPCGNRASLLPSFVPRSTRERWNARSLSSRTTHAWTMLSLPDRFSGHPPQDWPATDGRASNVACHAASRGCPSRQRSSAKRKSRYAQRNADRDVADREAARRQRIRLLLQRIHARHASLRCHSAMCGCALLLRRAKALAQPGQRDVQHAVAQRQAAQRGQPLGPCRGKQLRPVVQRVEILADHR